MIDWSAAGVSLSGPACDMPLGPATLAIPSSHGEDEIHLSCEIIWSNDGKIGLKLLGPASQQDNPSDWR